MPAKFEHPRRPLRRDSEPSAEDAFLAFIEHLDSATKSTPRFRDIVDRADETGEYEEALATLRQLASRRQQALDRVTVYAPNEHAEVRREEVTQLLDTVRRAIRRPEQLLGRGISADVYTLKRPSEIEEWLCVKMITNYTRYADGANTVAEMRLMDRVRDLRVEGVRAPVVHAAFSGIRFDGIVMEHLHASSLERVMSGGTTDGAPDKLPDGFDVEKFFARLRAYVEAMHAHGIVHKDFHPGNIMVDRETGAPYVIDFGSSVDLRLHDAAHVSPQELFKRDLKSLRTSENDLRAWLSGRP